MNLFFFFNLKGKFVFILAARGQFDSMCAKVLDSSMDLNFIVYIIRCHLEKTHL